MAYAENAHFASHRGRRAAHLSVWWRILRRGPARYAARCTSSVGEARVARTAWKSGRVRAVYVSYSRSVAQDCLWCVTVLSYSCVFFMCHHSRSWQSHVACNPLGRSPPTAPRGGATSGNQGRFTAAPPLEPKLTVDRSMLTSAIRRVSITPLLRFGARSLNPEATSASAPVLMVARGVRLAVTPPAAPSTLMSRAGLDLDRASRAAPGGANAHTVFGRRACHRSAAYPLRAPSASKRLDATWMKDDATTTPTTPMLRAISALPSPPRGAMRQRRAWWARRPRRMPTARIPLLPATIS